MAQKNAQPVLTEEHVPASEHGGGFPPFQKDTFASQILWLVLVFVALYLLMSRIALPRIGAIRNPAAADGQFGRLIFGFAVTEALGIFSLLIALLLLFAL